MRINQLTLIPDAESFRQQWNALVQCAQRPEVFYSYEWALAVQRAYRKSMPPWIVTMMGEDDSIVGLVALTTDSGKKQISFLAANTGDYCDFLTAAGQRDVFTEAVLSECKKLYSTVTFANLPADSETRDSIHRAARKCGFHVHERPAYECAQVCLKSPEERAQVQSSLQRKKMRRVLGAMEEKFPVKVDHLRSWAEVETVLPHFARAHVARFLATGRISNLVRPERRHFLEELAKQLSAQGWFALSQACAGDRPAVWNYGFRFLGSWFWYQPTFDTDLEDFSPGMYLLARIVQEACENPEVEVVDLGLGAEAYKERFANSRRQTVHITLSRSLLRHVAGILRYRAATWLTRMPAIEKAIRRSITLLAGARKRYHRQEMGESLRMIAKRASSLVFARETIDFYESFAPAADEPDEISLQPLDLNRLADAAMEHWDDESTLNYLLAAAQQLRNQNRSGFVLVNSQAKPLHFCWIAPMEGFRCERLKCSFNAPSKNSVLLCDSWTPKSLRGHGYANRAAALLAKKMAGESRRLWVLRGAGTANPDAAPPGFRLHHSLVRTKVLWWQKIVRRPAGADSGHVPQVQTNL